MRTVSFANDFDSADFYAEKKDSKLKRMREIDFDRLRMKQIEKRRDRNRHSKKQEQY